MTRVELKAALNEELGRCFYANSVVLKTIAHDVNYRLLSMSVNCGRMGSFLREETPEEVALDADFASAVPSLENNILSLTSPVTGTTYYTVDLNSVVSEGFIIQVEKLNDGKPFTFGVAVFRPEHADEIADAHRFTNDDCREAGETQCSSVMSGTFTFPSGVQCAREEGHIGNHQAFFNDYAYVFDTENRPQSGDPYGFYGFKNVCPHCGFVTAGSKSGTRNCSTCSFWLMHLEEGGGIVVDGRQYRPGRGGFGGHIWHVQHNDGTKWSGELFTQGEIPSWMRHLFPDNAKFLNQSFSF